MRDKGLLMLIRQDLKKNVDPVYREGSRNFFKEKVFNFGVRTPVVRKISAKIFREVKDKTKKDVFAICEELLEDNKFEEATIAFDWTFRLRKDFKKEDFKTFEGWLKKYVSNWATCDDFCGHAFGFFIYQFPEFMDKIFLWTASKNRWLRRASAVVLLYSIRRKNILKEIFRISKILLEDQDDLVQKGYGWLLKEASNHYQKEVFDFVMKHKDRMPRTSLRYAIEKMPANLKKQAMER